MKLASIVTALAILVAAEAAFGQDYARSGAYVGLNGVYGVETFDNVPGSLVDNSVGVAGRLGYRFSPWLAIEGQAEYSGDFVDGAPDATVTLVSVNGKLYPLSGRFQPYGLVGIGGAFPNIDFVPDDDSFLARFGGGVDFYLTDTFGLTLEGTYNMATDDPMDDFDYVSIGWGAFLRF